MKEHINKFFDAVDKLEGMDVQINGDLLTIMLLYSLPVILYPLMYELF